MVPGFGEHVTPAAGSQTGVLTLWNLWLGGSCCLQIVWRGGGNSCFFVVFLLLIVVHDDDDSDNDGDDDAVDVILNANTSVTLRQRWRRARQHDSSLRTHWTSCGETWLPALPLPTPRYFPGCCSAASLAGNALPWD